MPLETVCQCGAKFRFADELAGKQVNCTTCGRPVQVPGTAPPPPVTYVESPQTPSPPPQFIAAPSPPMASSGNVRAKLPGALIAAVVALFVCIAAAGGGMYVMNGQLKGLQERAAISDELRTKLADRLKEEREKITSLQEDFDKAQTKQNRIRETLSAAVLDINDLREKIRRQKADLNETITEAKAGFEDRAADLEGQIAELTTKVNANTANTDQLTIDLNDATVALIETQQKLNDAILTADNLQAQIDALPPAGDTIIDNSYIDKRITIKIPIITKSPKSTVEPLTKMIVIPTASIPAEEFTNFSPPGLITPGHSLLEVLNTSTGVLTSHTYKDDIPPNGPLVTQMGTVSSSLFPAAGPAGRYDFKHTEFSNPAAKKGKIFDFVVLDTFTGKVWHTSGATAVVINYVAPPVAGTDSRYRLDVSPENEGFTVTNTGPSLGVVNSWVNVVVGGLRNNTMTTVP